MADAGKGTVLDGKVVLVTGGTGSFGRKFAQIVLKECQPRALRVFSRDELKQQQMAEQFSDPRLRFLIGDVRDKERLHRALYGVDIVVHAAALKQVPSCEYNPFEAIKTNVLGGVNIIDAAIDNEVEKVIALSTDKAVNPANLYGATKLCAEKLFVHANSYVGDRRTRISCVRYGNVAGSRGSVIPLFLQQKLTGTVSITDERMNRFWVTQERAVRFTISCISRMTGGEVFIPKLPSMNVVDLADAIAPGCRKNFIGIRPGEKLNEVLITEEEARHTKEFEDHFVVEAENPFWPWKPPQGGRTLPEGFRYASDNNGWRLTKSETEKIVQEL